MRVLPALVLAALALPAAAHAQEVGASASAMGVGVQSTLTGLTGPTLTYQTPRFHLDGVLGFHDDGQTAFELAGRFWWAVHSTAASDFSIGGGLGVQYVDFGPDSDSDIHLELGAQLRAFVATNLAISASLGLGLTTGTFAAFDEGDESASFLGGQLVGAAGLTYFFF
jgi:hypothetical protein